MALRDDIFFPLLYSHITISDFKYFWPEHQKRDIICRNAHLVHQIGLLCVGMRPYKPKSSVAVGVARKESSLLKTMGAKHRSEFAALSPAMVKASG
jgi:hypothetical protein